MTFQINCNLFCLPEQQKPGDPWILFQDFTVGDSITLYPIEACRQKYDD